MDLKTWGLIGKRERKGKRKGREMGREMENGREGVNNHLKCLYKEPEWIRMTLSIHGTLHASFEYCEGPGATPVPLWTWLSSWFYNNHSGSAPLLDPETAGGDILCHSSCRSPVVTIGKADERSTGFLILLSEGRKERKSCFMPPASLCVPKHPNSIPFSLLRKDIPYGRANEAIISFEGWLSAKLLSKIITSLLKSSLTMIKLL